MTSSRRNVSCGLLLVWLVIGSFPRAQALPAFARKYGLRCSACHEAWPMLNYFGQKFKDNGYQLMNDRDAPIWQNPSYWPIALRITPFWHRESTDKVAVDSASGTGNQRISVSGFDYSGLDILTAGTLAKNISFQLVPSAEETGDFHIESANVRLDNLFHSPWLNLKLGKFELDNIVSEKRTLTLSANGEEYQIYHFIPVYDANIFGQIGDNQVGVEWMGHSLNDRTRISAALMSSTDGNPDLSYGSNSYSAFVAGSRAFDAGKFGVDRVGFYAMFGEAPTTYRTSGGVVIPGSGIGNKTFHREGFVGLFYFGKLDLQVVTQHGWDSAWFGTGYGGFDPSSGDLVLNNTPGTILPPGTRSPTWNGAFVETHYVVNPQLILIQRSEWVRMSQQALAGTPGELGNIDNYVVGFRWMPIMSSRAGFAWHNEFSWLRLAGLAPDGTDLSSNSVMSGFDFDF